MKRFQIDTTLGISGNNLGMEMPPLSNFMIAIPAVITTKTTASATDKADVNLNESARKVAGFSKSV